MLSQFRLALMSFKSMMCTAMPVTRQQWGGTVDQLADYLFCAGSLLEVKKRAWD